MFDSVTLLAIGGKMVFQGAPTEVVPHFTKLGYKLPYGENPADWMLDISSGTSKPETKEGERQASGSNIDRLIKEWKKVAVKSEESKGTREGGFNDKVVRPSFLSQYYLYFWRLFTQRFRSFRTILLDIILVVGSAYLAASVSGPFVPIIEEDEVINVPAEVIMNMTIPGFEKEEFPTPVLKSFEKANEYAMISNLLFVVLVTLSALRSFGDDKLMFYREASSGYSVSAFFAAQLTLDQIFHSLQALWTAVVCYELRTSLVPVESYIILYQLCAFFCTGWAYVFSLTVPRDNLVMSSALFVSVCGTLLSGSLTFLKFEDIYENKILALLVGMFSSTRWFSEWIIVSEFKALPAQYGYTDETLSYFERGGYALDDLDEATTMGARGWYYNVWPLLLVGIALRFVAYALIMLTERSKMNKKTVRKYGFLDWLKAIVLVILAFGWIVLAMGAILRVDLEEDYNLTII